MIIGLIAAVSDNGLVALDNNSLPWRMKSDMHHFRSTTEGCSLIVGRRTFETLPYSMLGTGDRQFFVLSKGLVDGYRLPNTHVVRSVDQALYQSAAMGRHKIWSIGGPQTWNECLIYAQKVVLSRIHTHVYQGIGWYLPTWVVHSNSLNGLPKVKMPKPVDLENRGFHLAMVEHHDRAAGDDHDWSVEYWQRGR